MDKRLLFEKEIEVLKAVKEELNLNDFNHFYMVRDGLYDFFFENEYNMRFEFISLFPAEDIHWVRNTIETLQKANSGIENEISGDNKKTIKRTDAIKNLEKIIKILEEALKRLPN